MLVELIEGSDLADRLSVDGPFTLPAPTDDAFAELSPGLLEIFHDPRILTRYSATRGSRACSVEDLRAAGVAPTLGQQEVQVDELVIVAPDIPAENGVVHGIGPQGRRDAGTLRCPGRRRVAGGHRA